jgi:hypothetical protein
MSITEMEGLGAELHVQDDSLSRIGNAITRIEKRLDCFEWQLPCRFLIAFFLYKVVCLVCMRCLA